MAKNKLKMSNKRFLAIFIPICAILLVLTIVLFVLADSYRVFLDGRFGRGTRVVERMEGTEDWDVDYYTSTENAKQKSEAVALELNREGEVLLKNNGALPMASGTTVVPFGRAYLTPSYSGSGAGASDTTDAVTPKAALSEFFNVSTAAERKMNASSPVSVDAAEGTRSVNDGTCLQNPESTLSEYDPSIYDNIDVEEGSVGIVFIGRTGFEGGDAKPDAYADGTPHYLALSQNEQGTIRAAKQLCDKVVVILNSPSVMELAPIMTGELEVDAILWVGIPGTQGFTAMGEILAGKVNPSGKTPDIYPTDFTKDPTYQNISYFEYSNAPFSTSDIYSSIWATADPTGPDHLRYYVEYQEGIYMGYRYYETADEVLDDFTYGTLDGEGAIEKSGAVAYPFGYGLSYTTFTQEIVSFDDSGDNIDMTVRVTNTGGVAGKDIVQVYYKAPYTEFDEEYLIEKASANLVTFDKTDMLQPNASEDVTVTFRKEDMASYCYTRNNPDGTKGCYFLENGEYEITIRANSHDVLDTQTTNISSDIWYDNSNPRQSEIDAQAYMNPDGTLENFAANGGEFVAATNQFEESNRYMQNDTSMLSRSDFEGTFPKTVAGRQKEASQAVLDQFERDYNFDYRTDSELGNVPGSKVYAEEAPTSGVDNGLSLIDMRGLNYYDPAWDALLDQIDYSAEREQIESILYQSAYGSAALDSVGLVPTVSADGDTGLSGGGASFPCKVIVAATWNLDLAYDMGEAVAQEGLSSTVNGWYAPAMNTHRSPFSGRNFEYYSEDGVLAGKLAARTVSGAGDNGMYCFIKHFVLNDQEAYRHIFISTWATEQTMREIYFKPFEITFKEAMMDVKYISDENGTVSTAKMRAATGVMMALNAIGTTVTYFDYDLMTDVLRNEWGFNGFVLTDFVFSSAKWMRDMSIRAGLTGWLSLTADSAEDYNSPTMQNSIREALHSNLYTIVNSAAYNGVAPGSSVYFTMSPWEIGLITGSCVIYAGIAAVIVWGIVRYKDSKKHPEKYKHKEKI